MSYDFPPMPEPVKIRKGNHDGEALLTVQCVLVGYFPTKQEAMKIAEKAVGKFGGDICISVWKEKWGGWLTEYQRYVAWQKNFGTMLTISLLKD